jgi:hypothetical protein
MAYNIIAEHLMKIVGLYIIDLIILYFVYEFACLYHAEYAEDNNFLAEDSHLHTHRRENLRSYLIFLLSLIQL